MERDLALILLSLLALCVLSMIRVCRESERIALSTPQHFVKLIGPSLFLRIPWKISPYDYTRIRIGDSERYIGNGWAKFDGANIMVRPVQDVDVDQKLRVKDFVNQEVFVEPSAGGK